MKNWFDKLNKKVVLGTLTMVLILCIIAVSSFIPFIIDPSKAFTKKFLTDELIVIAITLSVTITMMFVANASNASNPKSEISKARVEFFDSVKRITDKEKFFQWIRKVLRKKDKEAIIEREMERFSLPVELFYFDVPELKALKENAQKYDNKFYKRITEEQYFEIIRLKRKIKKMRFVEPNHYTTVKTIFPNKTNSEIASSETVKKVSFVIINVVSKIFLTLIFAFIVAALVVDATEGSATAAQMWMDFLSRLFAFSSSGFLGWTIGSKLNDIDAYYIRNRIEAHDRYLCDTNFVKVDEAKEEYIERVKKEQVLLGLKDREETKIEKDDKNNTQMIPIIKEDNSL